MWARFGLECCCLPIHSSICCVLLEHLRKPRTTVKHVALLFPLQWKNFISTYKYIKCSLRKVQYSANSAFPWPSLPVSFSLLKHFSIKCFPLHLAVNSPHFRVIHLLPWSLLFCLFWLLLLFPSSEFGVPWNFILKLHHIDSNGSEYLVYTNKSVFYLYFLGFQTLFQIADSLILKQLKGFSNFNMTKNTLLISLSKYIFLHWFQFHKWHHQSPTCLGQIY